LDSLMEDGSTPTATLLLGTRRLTPLLQVNVQLAESRFCHGLLKESRGNMDRRKQYVADDGVTYKKGYEVHNAQNPREIEAGNDLQHLKWKDGKSGGHIYYDKPN